MITRTLLFGSIAASIVVLHSSPESIVMDTIIGVAIAIALFVLYYALVLRRASGGNRPNM